MLELAADVHYLFDGPYEPVKVKTNYDWMIDRADLNLALWNGKKRGVVWQRLAYAQFRMKCVNNLYDFFERALTSLKSQS